MYSVVPVLLSVAVGLLLLGDESALSPSVRQQQSVHVIGGSAAAVVQIAHAQEGIGPPVQCHGALAVSSKSRHGSLQRSTVRSLYGGEVGAGYLGVEGGEDLAAGGEGLLGHNGDSPPPPISQRVAVVAAMTTGRFGPSGVSAKFSDNIHIGSGNRIFRPF